MSPFKSGENATSMLIYPGSSKKKKKDKEASGRPRKEVKRVPRQPVVDWISWPITLYPPPPWPFLLLLFLTGRPCVINKLTQFIHQRLEMIWLHQIEVHYQRTVSSKPRSTYPSAYEHPSSALHLTNDGTATCSLPEPSRDAAMLRVEYPDALQMRPHHRARLQH